MSLNHLFHETFQNHRDTPLESISESDNGTEEEEGSDSLSDLPPKPITLGAGERKTDSYLYTGGKQSLHRRPQAVNVRDDIDEEQQQRGGQYLHEVKSGVIDKNEQEYEYEEEDTDFSADSDDDLVDNDDCCTCCSRKIVSSMKRWSVVFVVLTSFVLLISYLLPAAIFFAFAVVVVLFNKLKCGAVIFQCLYCCCRCCGSDSSD